MQGIGYVTTEEIVYDENGRLLTDGTWEYKPPCSKCIPKVRILRWLQVHSKGKDFMMAPNTDISVPASFEPEVFSQDFRVTIYPGTQHEKHSRPLDRICHITSETDNHVIIGM